MKKTFLFFLFLFFYSVSFGQFVQPKFLIDKPTNQSYQSNSNQRYRQDCVVQYNTQNGWSKKYNVEVNFMFGSVLNNATNSFSYTNNSIYAVIFWGEDQASVIKIESFIPCIGFITKECLNTAVDAIRGRDQDGDEWKICVNNLC